MGKLPAPPTKNQKLRVFKRDKGICQYCQHSVSLENFTVDHRIPRILGGRSVLENLICACKLCNKAKGNMPEHEFRKLFREGGIKWRDAELRRQRARYGPPAKLGVAVDRGDDEAL